VIGTPEAFIGEADPFAVKNAAQPRREVFSQTWKPF
jgi:hypothetical protein